MTDLMGRARWYGYTGATKEQMLAALHHDGSLDTAVVLVKQWEAATLKVGKMVHG